MFIAVCKFIASSWNKAVTFQSNFPLAISPMTSSPIVHQVPFFAKRCKRIPPLASPLAQDGGKENGGKDRSSFSSIPPILFPEYREQCPHSLLTWARDLPMNNKLFWFFSATHAEATQCLWICTNDSKHLVKPSPAHILVSHIGFPRRPSPTKHFRFYRGSAQY